MEVEGIKKEEHGSLGMAMSPATTPMLSPENWERILSNLSPKDFRSAINTCPELNQLMTSKKSCVLFPQILPMLITRLPLETILKCRQLSKDVKHLTDKPLSNDPRFKVTLTGGTKIARFISLMESRPFPEENPFIRRSVVTRNLQGMTDEQTNRRVEAVRQVLARYGQHVWKFEFKEDPIELDMLETYVSLLRLLPNLKSIVIVDCLLYVWNGNLRSLALPKLDKLEDLSLIGFDILEHSWSSSVFGLRLLDEYGHQLKSLYLDEYFFHPFVSNSRSLDSLAPNLVRFSLDSSNSSTLKKLAAVKTWKLEDLDLFGDYKREALSDLLAVVNNFANTLVSLSLSWNPGEVRNLPKHRCNVPEMVMLPKLLMLRLLLVALKVDWIWEFLKRGCKQLKVIFLDVEDDSEMKNAEEIGLLGMYTSRLFSILPMLSKIVIRNCTTLAVRVIFRKADM